MRYLLFATCLTVAPAVAQAQSLCGTPALNEAPPTYGHPTIILPSPSQATAPAPARAPTPGGATADTPLGSTIPALTEPAATAPPQRPAEPAQLEPVLQRIARAGARLEELGQLRGMRSVVARTGDEFMLLFVAPDGQAAVSGLMADLSLEQLRRIGATGFTDLGERHGLRAAVVRSGTQFQVFYATPDGTAVIPGIMWDTTGRNLTRDHVSGVPGAIPTVTIGDVPPQAPAPNRPPVPGSLAASPPSRSAAPASSPRAGLSALNAVYAGSVGNANAPELRMFVDPRCGYSEQAMMRLQPLVANGRVRLTVIPISILDPHNGGESTRATLAMLSKPADEMVAAWSRNDLSTAASGEATGRLQANMAAAAAIGLRGTPTFLWRRADGSEGRQDGLPSDVGALVAAVAGR